MKKLFNKIKCWFGWHKIKYVTDSENLVMYCENCDYTEVYFASVDEFCEVERNPYASELIHRKEHPNEYYMLKD